MTVFDDVQDQETPENEDTTPADPFADKLAAIKNFDGEQKYDSVEKALEALKHSQAKIAEQAKELADAKEKQAELERKALEADTLEDVIKRLNLDEGENREEVVTPSTKGLTEEAVLDLIRKANATERESEMKKINKAEVQKTLVDKFGDKAAEVVEQKAAELGTTKEALGKLAEENPRMALALFGNAAPSNPRPATTSVTIPSTTVTEPEIRKPDKSLLSGATSEEQAAFMRSIRDHVYKKYNVET